MKRLVERLQCGTKRRRVKSLRWREVTYWFQAPEDHDAGIREKGVGIQKIRAAEEIAQDSAACRIEG